MKKLLLSICLFFIYFGNANANLIELEKCFYTKNWWDYTKQGTELEFPTHEQIKWTEENYIRASTQIKISKEIWKKNLDKFHKFNDDFSRQNFLTRIDMYPRIDFTLLKTSDYTKSEIEEIKSLGGKIVKKYKRRVYSIDPDSGIVTVLRVMSDEYYNYEISYLSELKLGKVHPKFKEFANENKKSHEKMYNDRRNNGPIDITKFVITSYAGGLLKAVEQDSIIDFQMVIDFNNLTIKTKNKFEFVFTNQRCPDDYVDSGQDQSPGGSSGTAFFINSKGYLLTNNHVVEGCKLSKISYKNKDVDAKLIATDKTLDLALLKVKVRPKSFISFSKDEPKKLNEIFVAGYPLGKGLSDDLKISSGIISSLKGFEDNSNEIQIDAPINPGNSGGPIINKNGSLVGIAVSGMAKDQTEGINFGIKASAAESFLKSNKINPIKSLNSKKKDNDQLLNILEEGTVYTFCE